MSEPLVSEAGLECSGRELDARGIPHSVVSWCHYSVGPGGLSQGTLVLSLPTANNEMIEMQLTRQQTWQADSYVPM